MAISMSSPHSPSSHTTLSQLSQILSFNVMYWPSLPELFDPIEEFDGDPARLYVPPPPSASHSDDDDDDEDSENDGCGCWELDKPVSGRLRYGGGGGGGAVASRRKRKHSKQQQRFRDESSVVTPYHNVRKRRQHQQHDRQQHLVRFACHKCGMVFNRLYDHQRHVTAVHVRKRKPSH